MIRRVTVSAFKAIEQAKIDFPPLTIFIGENGTGKSSIIHALSILKRSKGTTALNTDLPYADLGPISGLVVAGREATITFDGEEEVVGLDPDSQETAHFTYNCKVAFDAQGLSKYSVYSEFGKLRFSNEWSRYGAPSPETTPWTFDNIAFNLGQINEIGRAFGLRGYSFPSVPRSDMENRRMQYRAQNIYQSLERISLTIGRDLERFFVVPPLRGFTEASYSFLPSPNQELVCRAPESQTQMAANLKYWENNEREISELLSRIVGVELRVGLDAGPSLRVLNAKNMVNFVNEGFGSNQLLWVFERIVNSPDQSLIAVEEPETHLHPKAQFALGRLLSEISFEKKRLILVTHSPQILSGVLTSIKSKKIRSKDVGLYFFEKKATTIQATRASIDEQGIVTEGLRGFMEAAASELIEYSSAGTDL